MRNGKKKNKRKKREIKKKKELLREVVSHDSLMQPVFLNHHVLLNQLCHAVVPRSPTPYNAATLTAASLYIDREERNGEFACFYICVEIIQIIVK